MANNTLEVTKRDGTTARLVHIPTRRFLARAPNGETVEVEARARHLEAEGPRREDVQPHAARGGRAAATLPRCP
jgi:hypothetical protein